MKHNYNQLQKYLRHSTIFWLKWPVHDLVLVTSPPPLFKVASNTRPCSKLAGTTLNGGGGRSVFYLTDLWLAAIWSKTGCFSWECLNIFATGCSSHYSDFLHYLNMNFFEYSLDDFHAVCFWESLAGGL